MSTVALPQPSLACFSTVAYDYVKVKYMLKPNSCVKVDVSTLMQRIEILVKYMLKPNCCVEVDTSTLIQCIEILVKSIFILNTFSTGRQPWLCHNLY